MDSHVRLPSGLLSGVVDGCPHTVSVAVPMTTVQRSGSKSLLR
jgi:hypothetical protein